MEKIETKWQRSSFCGGGGNNCVEVMATARDSILRESSDPAETLRMNGRAFRSLVAAIKTGRFADLAADHNSR